jgi:hypothetical protein
MKNLIATTQTAIFNKLIEKGVSFKKGEPKPNTKRLVKGNTKLHNILIFDLTAGKDGSCKSTCSKCYAIKAEVQYSNCRLFRAVNLELAKNHLVELETILIDQLSRAKTKMVRIHSAGDFFSQKYVDMWSRIVKAFPDMKFYAYTKNENDFDFSGIKKNQNFNLLNSFAEIDGEKVLNYGDKEHVEKLVDSGYFLCPATVKEKTKDIKCGLNCKYCMSNDKVCFNIH